MAQIAWTQAALDDLDDIANYIALSNPAEASALVQRTFDTVERLAQFPESGRILSEISEFNYREEVVEPLRIFYKVQQQQVYIVHVLRFFY